MKKKLTIDQIFVSTRGKILLTILTVILAVSLSWVIIHTVFNETQQAVVKLTTPNQRLLLIDNLYYSINQLNQFQYKEGGRNTKQSSTDLSKVFRKIQYQLDSLSLFTTAGSRSIVEIDSLKQLIHHHKIVYIRYLKLKSEVVKNNQFKRNVDNLTKLLLVNPLKTDSSVVTSNNKTITILEPTPLEGHASKTQIGSLLEKIFGKRKNKQEVKKTVIEEVNTKVDTISLSQKDSIRKVVMGQLAAWSSEQQQRTLQFISREKLLFESGNKLLASIYLLLSEMKQLEAQNIRNESKQAANTLEQGLFKFNAIMVVFFFIIGILALLILFDITRSNSYRKDLQKAKDEAERLSLAKQRFLANMSHEIRTPLQAIVGFSEQANQNKDVQGNANKVIYESSLHLMQVVNEVLDYSRIISGKVTISPASFNLGELITELTHAFELSSRNKKFTFKVEHRLIPNVYYKGDAFRIKQILYNLVGNAFKFTERGEVCLRIEVDPERNDIDKIQFIVSDTGMGMSEDQLVKVFNEFEQGTSDIANNYGGTGLGLTITKELIQAMNGTIDVKSNLSVGTVFRVLLHLPKSVFQDAADSLIEVNKSYLRKIWFVDDDAYIRKVCEGIFNKYALDFVIFSSAMQMLTNEWKDEVPLFMVDIRMQDMSGIELCKRIKERSSDAIVLAVTAQSLPDEQQYILENGFDDILTKPFTEADLMKKVIELSKITFDLTAFKKFSMNDDVMIAENLQAFIHQTQEDLNHLHEHLLLSDKTACYEVLHRLSGRVGLVGAEALGRMCRKLEVDLAAAVSLKPFINRIYNLTKEITALLVQLRAEG